MSIEVVCCIRMKDSQIYHHLTPIAQHPDVSRIWIIRPMKVGGSSSFEVENLEIPKAEYVTVPGLFMLWQFRLWQFIRMTWHCIRLGRRKEVKVFVSFQPIPYGLFSWLGARINRKAIHFGFVGEDWNRDIKKLWGKFLLPVFRRGDFAAVPGEDMSVIEKPNTEKVISHLSKAGIA